MVELSLLRAFEGEYEGKAHSGPHGDLALERQFTRDVKIKRGRSLLMKRWIASLLVRKLRW
jgi:hypothetical protein